ncbi:MAG: hypothetical protein P8O89_08550 [Polaribacter sp.]|nr:hypothetical protein [Polaribacter sp.]
MKKYFLTSFILISSLLCAQDSSTDVNARLDVTGELTVGNSGLWIKPSKRPEIKGDIYLFKGWNNLASIITGKGEKYKLKNINFDTNQKMFAMKTAIDSVFVFSRESIKQVMVNNKMFKRYSKDFVYDYYEVIAFGKGKEVLKQSFKVIKKGSKDPFTNTYKGDEYVLKSKYFFNSVSGIKEIKLKKKPFSNLFGDDSKNIKEIISKQKISLKKDSDIIKLFKFYNKK